MCFCTNPLILDRIWAFIDVSSFWSRSLHLLLCVFLSWLPLFGDGTRLRNLCVIPANTWHDDDVIVTWKQCDNNMLTPYLSLVLITWCFPWIDPCQCMWFMLTQTRYFWDQYHNDITDDASQTNFAVTSQMVTHRGLNKMIAILLAMKIIVISVFAEDCSLGFSWQWVSTQSFGLGDCLVQNW